MRNENIIKQENPQCVQTSVSSSVSIESDLIGIELFYRSEITKCYTKFKVKNVIIHKEIISKSLCFSIYLISENNNKYTYEEDFIFSAIP
jgi:hypothetical protein